MAKRVDPNSEHLKLLSLGHKVLAGIMAFFGSFPILHVIMGIAIINGGFEAKGQPPPPAFMGYLFAFVGVFAITIGWSLAIANWQAGKRIAERRSRTFCQVVAGFNCLWVPIGTILGALSFIVLNRPAVRAEFAGEAPPEREPTLSARPRAGAGLRCPYCHDSVGSNGVACTACLAPHHTDCWDETRACSNCSGTERYAQVERTDDGTVRASRKSLKE